MPKSTNILIRVSPEEKAAFEEAAKLAGMKLSAWVRAHLVAVCRSEHILQEPAQDRPGTTPPAPKAPAPTKSAQTPPKARQKPLCPSCKRKGGEHPVKACPICNK